MKDCTLCPRACHADRAGGHPGFCGESAVIRGARAGLHFWEEPILSGTKGSGTVFFSGCNLRCVFCQNRGIALGKAGYEITPQRLSEIFLELQDQGAHNINLVTGTHFLPQIALALEMAKPSLDIPVVYNTSSYELPESLRLLEGLADIYLPDMKYFSPELSQKYAAAQDYFDVAMDAVREMLRQVGPPVSGSDGLLQKGVIVRHLILPGQTKDSKKILRRLHEEFGGRIYISIMNQYTPMGAFPGMEELERSVTPEEYGRVLRFAERIGIERGFFQEGGTVSDSFIPAFDGTGILKP
ncbi:MAG: radical SAM protein [Lachnospiraceae bacterium]|nr:radical SAM protein [Lachnospiraceae bacterium]